MIIDKFPSTPVKLIWAQMATIIFFVFSLFIIWTNRDINEYVFSVLAGYALGIDIAAVVQFAKKRSTAWVPPQTPSEAVKPQSAGQPVVPAPVA